MTNGNGSGEPMTIETRHIGIFEDEAGGFRTSIRKSDQGNLLTALLLATQGVARSLGATEESVIRALKQGNEKLGDLLIVKLERK